MLAELNALAAARGSGRSRLPQLRIPSRQAAGMMPIAALDRSQAAAVRSTTRKPREVKANGFADDDGLQFLYNETRHLFSIGYNVQLERLDSGHYDLLASEAALDVLPRGGTRNCPRKHWFQLGRLITPVGEPHGADLVGAARCSNT